jgi:hypothetical protein
VRGESPRAAAELYFRRIHEGEGFITYFWKFRPA